MKSIHTFLVLISFCAFLPAGQAGAKAQNTTPTIAENNEFTIGLGEHQKIDGVTITFFEVLEDSRCPKDVDCVWAGQAKIKVRIKEKGVAPVEKVIIFDAIGKDIVLHSSKKTVIKAVRLLPYPNTSMAVADRVYFLEIRG